MDTPEKTLAMVKGLAALGVIRATFSTEGELTSFELSQTPDTVPAPPEVDQTDLLEVADDITQAANRLMGRGGNP